jgi:hypothetical protein
VAEYLFWYGYVVEVQGPSLDAEIKPRDDRCGSKSLRNKGTGYVGCEVERIMPEDESGAEYGYQCR